MKNLLGKINPIVSSIILLPLIMNPPAAASSQAGLTELVSISGSGQAANQGSAALSISSDGRFVAFASAATDLVPNDTNGVNDIFLRDRSAGTTERVSISTQGEQANQFSYNPSVSADGRWIAFESEATNLVPGDSNGMLDIFVRDRQSGTTQRVSLSTGGAQGNGPSRNAVISGDGRFVAFTSDSTNLVPGDTNQAGDIFVRDLQTNTTERISVAGDGSQANDTSDEAAITPDGRYVAFASFGSNLVSGDTNGVSDIFVHDRQASTTERVSLYAGGAQGTQDCATPSLSADGRIVAFAGRDPAQTDPSLSGLLAIFVRDRQAGSTETISISTAGATANDNSYTPSLSADGTLVAFVSDAWNLVDGDTNEKSDIFLRDRAAKTTERVSVSSSDAQGDGASDAAMISSDGQTIAFRSAATNLLGSSDKAGQPDIYAHLMDGN
jgi:Tol biopolymer transport system component